MIIKINRIKKKKKTRKVQEDRVHLFIVSKIKQIINQH